MEVPEPAPPRWPRRHVLALPLALVVLLAGAGLGWRVVDGHASTGRTPSHDPAPRAATASGSTKQSWDVRVADASGRFVAALRLTSARERALRTRDRAGFLATVDPRARGFRTAQAAMFDHLAGVPVAGWQVQVDGAAAFSVGADSSGAHAAGGDGASSPSSFTLPVTVRHRLASYDTGWVAHEARLTLVRRGPRWYVAAEKPADPGGNARAARDLWQLGDVQVVRTGHVLALGTVSRDVLARVAAETEDAAPRVSRTWGRGWARRVVVLVPRTVGEMASVIGTRPREVTRIAAVTTGQVPGASGGRADRVVVNPEAFAGLSATGRQVVLTHEVTHVAAREATTAETPTWLAEGLADYVAYRGTGIPRATAASELFSDVRNGRVPHGLPSSDDFAGTADGLAQAYEMAWLACVYVADGHGEDTLFRFYRAVGRDGLVTALDEVLGTTLGGFTSDWRAFVQSEARA